MRGRSISLYTSGLSDEERGLTGVEMIGDLDDAIARSIARTQDPCVAVIPKALMSSPITMWVESGPLPRENILSRWLVGHHLGFRRVKQADREASTARAASASTAPSEARRPNRARADWLRGKEGGGLGSHLAAAARSNSIPPRDIPSSPAARARFGRRAAEGAVEAEAARAVGDEAVAECEINQAGIGPEVEGVVAEAKLSATYRLPNVRWRILRAVDASRSACFIRRKPR